jgi:hypothetical protein
VDRFLKDDVFLADEQPKHRLILLGSSHLNRIAEYVDQDKYEVINLCKPGFRITDNSVKDLVRKLEAEMPGFVIDSCTVVMQLFDNSRLSDRRTRWCPVPTGNQSIRSLPYYGIVTDCRQSPH